MEVKDVVVLVAILIIIFTFAAVITFIETPPKYEMIILPNIVNSGGSV
jgi:hypothetical protein